MRVLLLSLVMASPALCGKLSEATGAALKINSTHPQRVLGGPYEKPDDNERMMGSSSKLTNFFKGSSSEATFTKIRAGNPEESNTSQKIIDVLSTLDHMETKSALSKHKSLVKHFIGAWHTDVVATALVRARKSSDARVAENARILSRQLMKHWDKKELPHENVFDELKLESADYEHVGLTDERIVLLDEYITYIAHGKPSDLALSEILERKFKGNANFAWINGRVKEGNKIEKRYVWSMVLQSNGKPIFTRLELSTGEVEVLDFDTVASDFTLPLDSRMEKLDEVVAWFGSEGNFAMLLLRTMEQSKNLKFACERYEELLFRRFRNQQLKYSDIMNVVFKDVPIHADSTRLIEFSDWYGRFLEVDKDPPTIFTSSFLERFRRSLGDQSEEFIDNSILNYLIGWVGGKSYLVKVIRDAIKRGHDLKGEGMYYENLLNQRLQSGGDPSSAH